MIDIEKANTTAVEKMMEARPIVVGVARALDVIPGMRKNLFLHAGPPVYLGENGRPDARRVDRIGDV